MSRTVGLAIVNHLSNEIITVMYADIGGIEYASGIVILQSISWRFLKFIPNSKARNFPNVR
jgi:hypothetical protein